MRKLLLVAVFLVSLWLAYLVSPIHGLSGFVINVVAAILVTMFFRAKLLTRILAAARNERGSVAFGSMLLAAALSAIAPIVARVGSRALQIVFALLRNGALVGIEQAMEVGRAVVAELATTDLTNEQKRSAAFGRIAERLVAAGGAVVASEINLAVELLVAERKRILEPTAALVAST